MNKQILYGLLALVLVTFACRPILVMSWNEFLILAGLIVVLLGPSLYKLIRRVENFFKQKEQNK